MPPGSLLLNLFGHRLVPTLKKHRPSTVPADSGRLRLSAAAKSLWRHTPRKDMSLRCTAALSPVSCTLPDRVRGTNEHFHVSFRACIIKPRWEQSDGRRGWIFLSRRHPPPFASPVVWVTSWKGFYRYGSPSLAVELLAAEKPRVSGELKRILSTKGLCANKCMPVSGTYHAYILSGMPYPRRKPSGSTHWFNFPKINRTCCCCCCCYECQEMRLIVLLHLSVRCCSVSLDLTPFALNRTLEALKICRTVGWVFE